MPKASPVADCWLCLAMAWYGSNPFLAALETTENATACGEELDRCLDTLPPVVQTQLDQILAQASAGGPSWCWCTARRARS
jgi:hypothetical protein